MKCRAASRTSGFEVIALISGSPATRKRSVVATPKPEPQANISRTARLNALRSRAGGLAAKLLGCRRKAVEEEAADHDEVVQHRVRGEQRVARPGTLRGEERERCDQRHGADHDVAIDGEHAHDLAAVEN